MASSTAVLIFECPNYPFTRHLQNFYGNSFDRVVTLSRTTCVIVNVK